MKYRFYDTHAHTNMPPLLERSEEIIAGCKKQEIMFNVVGTNLEDSNVAIDQAKNHDNVKAIIGIHPSEVCNLDLKDTISKIENLYLNNKKSVVAFGETGLDYHYDNTDKAKQKDFFIEHIKLSNKFNIPLVVHVRDAHDDCLKILDEFVEYSDMVLIHCFSSDVDLVKKYVERNYYISIPGIITFKKAFILHEAIKHIPLEKLLIETDCPWLSPEPNRGKINSPLNIVYIAKDIANKLNYSEQEMENILMTNSNHFFDIE